jgi:myo-inositol 2-dehydrogenase / D-chiro-inositol 1-dehydrogenase
MKVALIGAGRIGRMHGSLLASRPDVDEVLVHDAVAATAAAVAAEIGGRPAARVDEALAAADAVVIAAPTNAHATLVRRAVEAGRPTFVEKPLAFDLGESEDLADLVERTGARVQVGFQRRFDPAYRQAADLVRSGRIGRLYVVRLIAHDDAPPPEAYIPTSGGLFRDSTIHDFDALRFVTGLEVEEVIAVGSVRVSEMFARYQDIDTVGAILTLTDGTLAVLSQTRHDPLGYDIRMELVGSSDAVSVGQGPRTPNRSLEPDAGPRDTSWDGFMSRFATAYRAELEAFLAFARGEIESPCTARDGLEAMRIAIAAGRSLEDGRPVRVADVTGRAGAAPVGASTGAEGGGQRGDRHGRV